MPNLSTITPETRKEEFLDRIARAAASPNLPEVDTSDNGDVLTVVSGEWAAAAPQGGNIPASREDIGKYLGVKESETETEIDTVIPLQTSAITQGFATLNNCNMQFFKNASVGDTITAVIDGTEMTLTATDMGGSILFINGNHAVGSVNDIVIYGYSGGDAPASVTISATAVLPAPEVDWLAVPGPLVVTVISDVSNATYNQVKEAIDRGASVRFIYNSRVTGYLYCGFAVSYEYDSEAVDSPYKVYVIRPDYDVQLGPIAMVVDTFDSTDADTNNLSLK